MKQDAMFNVCPQCGVYDVEKDVDAAASVAVCPHCGARIPFRWLPLFVVAGASGAGKTTICLTLAPRMADEVCIETDILWGVVPATPEDDYRSYGDTWLRLAKNIGQAGRPVALFGTAVPEQIESCPERRYFAAHYIALACDDDVLAARLRARPAWRRSGSEAFVAEMRAFNGWLRAHAADTDPPMTLLDTTRAPSRRARRRWQRGCAPASSGAATNPRRPSSASSPRPTSGAA